MKQRWIRRGARAVTRRLVAAAVIAATATACGAGRGAPGSGSAVNGAGPVPVGTVTAAGAPAAGAPAADAPAAAATRARGVGAPGVHGPPQGVAWQYQLQPASGPFARSGGIDVTICDPPLTGGPCVRPRVFDIDLYGPDGVTPDSSAVRAIRRAGGYPICYVDAGTWENWRPDAGRFPHAVLGRPNGWPGERWLDIRQTGILLPLIEARVAKCASAGFQGVEYDNVDGYTNDTGFPLTAAEQLRYDRALAVIAHRHGLAAGLKNDYDQVAELLGWFDFTIDEQCAQYAECPRLRPFVAAGKAVFDVEYASPAARLCGEATAAGADAITKRPDLLALPWRPCR